MQRSIFLTIFATMPNRLTINGVMLFVIGLLLGLSGFEWARPELGGLLVHPYMLAIAAIMPLMVISRLQDLPARVLMSLGVFGTVYILSTIRLDSGRTEFAISESVKICAAIGTVITTALLVRSWKDFTAGVVGMSLAVGILGIRGVQGLAESGDPSAGIYAIQAANRNAFSLYALPPVLLALYVLLNSEGASLLTKVILSGSVVANCLAIALNLNRSGWLGLAVIAAMLTFFVRGRAMKVGAVVIAVGFVVAIVVTRYFGTTHLETRWEATQRGLDSDEHRWTLIAECFEIGMQNPLLGASPRLLPQLLARRLGHGGTLYSHNAFAHIVGGSGFLCLFALLYVGFTLWTWSIPPNSPKWMKEQFHRGLTALRLVLILWFVRGMFTHEILYVGAFNLALGMCAGLCIAATPRLRIVQKQTTEPERG